MGRIPLSKINSSLPRVKKVGASRKAPLSLDVTWSDGEKSHIDLTGLVHSSRHFRVFADDAPAFRKVRPVGFGSGIGWNNGLDYSAATLKTLADQQRVVSGHDLVAFEKRHGLNTAETAILFHIAERTVRAYREMDALPEALAIALRALDADGTVFAAHYRPVARRARGRPQKLAAE